ncbi:urocortin 3, like [Stigmatopora argus]
MMLSSLKTLVLLSVLCAPAPTPSSGLCLLRLARGGRSDVPCERQMVGGFPPEGGWSSLLRSSSSSSSSASAEFLATSSSEESASRERRTSDGPARSRSRSRSGSRFQSPAKVRGTLQLRNGGKEERRSWRYLSLDVPTYIMNVLLAKAKDQQVRDQAAANAQLLAAIGRRK